MINPIIEILAVSAAGIVAGNIALACMTVCTHMGQWLCMLISHPTLGELGFFSCGIPTNKLQNRVLAVQYEPTIQNQVLAVEYQQTMQNRILAVEYQPTNHAE